MNFTEKSEGKALPTPENQAEQLPSLETERVREVAPAPAEKQPTEALPTPVLPLPNLPVRPVAPSKDPELMQVERVLEDNLLDVYLGMAPAERSRFKAAGETAATKINELVGQSKATAKAVLKLILDWLKLIPGVNKFFLEQEAKLKTDRVMRLAAQRRDKQNGLL